MDGHSIRWAASLVMVLAMGGCDASERAPGAAQAITSEASPTASLAPPPPRYDEEDGGVYYYVSAVSEEDQKKGKAVGAPLGFRYLGKNDKGEHVLASLANDGTTLFKSYCSDPCKVIRRGNERIGFVSESIIGAAFEDAINGHLKPAKPVVAESVGSEPNQALAGETKLWIGRFTGTFEGGADGDLTISPANGERVDISLSIGGPSCTGDVAGSGVISDSQLVITKPQDESGNRCRLTLFRRGDRIDITEESCSYFHGFECSFSGQVRRR